MHKTSTYRDFTVQGALALPPVKGPAPGPPDDIAPMLVKYGGQEWRPVQACSLENPLLVTPGGQDWRPVQTSSFDNLHPLHTHTGADIWWMATEAGTMGE